MVLDSTCQLSNAAHFPKMNSSLDSKSGIILFPKHHLVGSVLDRRYKATNYPEISGRLHGLEGVLKFEFFFSNWRGRTEKTLTCTSLAFQTDFHIKFVKKIFCTFFISAIR